MTYPGGCFRLGAMSALPSPRPLPLGHDAEEAEHGPRRVRLPFVRDGHGLKDAVGVRPDRLPHALGEVLLLGGLDEGDAGWPPQRRPAAVPVDVDLVVAQGDVDHHGEESPQHGGATRRVRRHPPGHGVLLAWTG
jgi:hypothetical protein